MWNNTYSMERGVTKSASATLVALLALTLQACSQTTPPAPVDPPCAGFVATLPHLSGDRQQAIADTTQMTDFDQREWSSAPQPSHGKRGSGVAIYYRFKERNAGEWKMDIALADVLHDASVAAIYGIDGARIAGNSPHSYWLLKASAVNELSLPVLATGQGGAVAVATCQAGRVSVRPIVLPGRKLTTDAPAGVYQTDAEGNTKIQMQVPPDSK